jgi:hypothetical protein
VTPILDDDVSKWKHFAGTHGFDIVPRGFACRRRYDAAGWSEPPLTSPERTQFNPHIAHQFYAKGGRMAISLDIPTLTLIADISTPHMKAINEAVTAAFPNDSDLAYTLALGVQLSALLYVLDPTVRPKAVEAINRLLEKNRSGYKLVSIS